MNFVLDASVALAWCFEDEADAYSDAVLESLIAGEAVVPALWPTEVTNGLATAERCDRLDRASAGEARRLLQALPIAVDPLERRRVFEAIALLAGTRALTTYDACYLELARRRGIPLATLDAALRRAAEAEGVPLYRVASC
ncbi:MAG: type II toxin-antitoxin system VapC family toxin [Gemmatimonadetes bacterium]|nr:type II toxin-antitoxin system VapC family toxin [Gemmatimonadota bacterium]